MNTFHICKATGSICEYTPVQIQYLFNNRTLTDIDYAEYPDIYHGISGTTIKSKSFITGGCYSEYADAYFEIVGPNSRYMDNLIPTGQIIKEVDIDADQICILGFSEWINADFEYTVVFEDGKRESCRGYLYSLTDSIYDLNQQNNIVIEYKEWGKIKPVTFFGFTRNCGENERNGFIHCTKHRFSGTKKIKEIMEKAR